MKKIVSGETSSPNNIRGNHAFIVISASIQVLCATCLLYIPAFQYINSLLFLVSGLAISFFVLYTPSLRVERPLTINRQLLLKLFFILLLLPASYQLARQIMDSTPLQIEYADMLPIMKTMSSRFINGQWDHVYDPINNIWNGVQPIYLPAMWVPFTSSLLFHFDMRWITLCGIWLAVILCMIPCWKINGWTVLYLLIILLLLCWLHLDIDNNVIRLTEEGVVFFYYSLMVVAINSGNPWLVGISAALCLLSRYAIIGWIPFAGLYLLLTRQYKYLLKSAIAGTIVVLLLVIIPFGIKPLLLHLQLPAEYVQHANRIWIESPEYFYQSLGMAKFFGAEHSYLLHSILLGGTFILPLLFLIFIKKKSFASTSVLLAGLQLSITFFYNFLDVTYQYLYYTPVFVSLVIAGWTLKRASGNTPY
jgi:hypothetical protein